MYCEIPEAARRSRLAVMEDAVAGGLPIFTARFAATSVGRVHRERDGLAWSFV